jgi:chromosome segregation ATPase
VYELHQKTGIKNLVLEKKLETIQESLETKDAQINQLLAAAKIDPKTLGVIKSTLEEVENLKNEAIKEIQAELKKIREAHSNMVKTYEGKLSEFGIPVEELGFDPLVPANI